MEQEFENKNIYKIKEIGLDLTNLDYEPSEIKFNCIHTSISSNNTFLVDKTKKNINKIYTTIDFLDGAEQAIDSHLLELKESVIDVLLIDSDCNFKKYKDNLSALIDHNLVVELGISNPINVNQLEEINSIIDFNYISLNICPLNFNFEIIEWANKNNKKIIGFNPFGGHLTAPTIIESFTSSYLLDFISTYSDIVFLSSKDLLYSNINYDYLKELIGKDIYKICILNKNIDRLIKPLKKAIDSYLNIDENMILPIIGESKHLFSYDNISLSVSSSNEDLTKITKNIDTDELSKYINEYLQSIHLTEDGSNSDQIALIRSGISSLIRAKYYDINLSIIQNKLCDNIFIFTVMTSKLVKKNWLKSTRISESNNYLLYCKDKKSLFTKLKDATEKDQNS